MLYITRRYGNTNKHHNEAAPYLEWLIFKTLTMPSADGTMKELEVLNAPE